MAPWEIARSGRKSPIGQHRGIYPFVCQCPARRTATRAQVSSAPAKLSYQRARFCASLPKRVGPEPFLCVPLSPEPTLLHWRACPHAHWSISFYRTCLGTLGKTHKRGMAKITTATRASPLALSRLRFPLFEGVGSSEWPFFWSGRYGQSPLLPSHCNFGK